MVLRFKAFQSLVSVMFYREAPRVVQSRATLTRWRSLSHGTARRAVPPSHHVTSGEHETAPSSLTDNPLGYQSPPFMPTPAHVQVQGVLIRGIAWLVDSIVLGVVTSVVFALTLIAFSVGPSLSPLVTSSLGWIGIPEALLVQFTYFTALEGRYGQTLGKLVSEIKVVNEDGSRIGYKTAALRTILRLIDFLPILYGVGALLIWSSDKRQRLGDVVAHTIVISHVRYTSI